MRWAMGFHFGFYVSVCRSEPRLPSFDRGMIMYGVCLDKATWHSAADIRVTANNQVEGQRRASNGWVPGGQTAGLSNEFLGVPMIPRRPMPPTV